MYAVIFSAETADLDDEYSEVAATLRKVATQDYGCLEYIEVTEGNRELVISYWRCMADIHKWKANIQHRSAQERGRKKWYKDYKVQVVEVLRSYSMGDQLVRQTDSNE